MSQVAEKLDGYDRGHRSGVWHKKFGRFPDVAFVTTSDTRKRALLRVAEGCGFRVKVLTLDEIQAQPGDLIQ